MRKHPSKRKRVSSQRVSEKIELLRHEGGVPEKQAVGEAYGMEKSGRLKRHGRYMRKGSRRK